MKKLMIFVVVFLFVVSFAFSENDFTFKAKIKFGMSKEQISNFEDSVPVLNEHDMLAYRTSINNNEAYLYYVFYKDKLCRIFYFIGLDYPIDFLREYKTIVKMMAEKYGAMEMNHIELMSNNPWGSMKDSIYYGFLALTTNLTINDVNIWTVLKIRKVGVKILIYYDYIPLYDKYKKALRNQQKGKL